ncbi:hypothetical protein KY330_03805 [Candidatus Woesearchaeota archaeon]|nr:hypothetical protein [Candidatus Woesearchaeota archaeon]
MPAKIKTGLVKQGDYIVYGRADGYLVLENVVFGVGRVLNAEDGCIRAEVYEYKARKQLGEKLDLEEVLLSRWAEGSWEKKECVIDSSKYDVNISNNKYPYYTVEGWLRYKWNNVKLMNDERLDIEMEKRKKMLQEFMKKKGNKAKDMDEKELAFYLPYCLIAEVGKK